MPALDPLALRAAFRDAGVKEVHLSTVFQHVMDSAESAPEDFWELRRKHPQLPLALPQLLTRSFTRCSSHVVDFFPGQQGGKMLVELQDGQRIETVLIEHAGPKPRSTVCVSSQIGCKMGCRFCATGTMGLRGQLSAGEILEQLLHAKRWARKEAPVRNVVFMGMGEPLDNYENVMAAVKVMPEHAFGVALKNVTISTVGVPGRIRALGHEIPAGPNLALSLHAPTQDLRIELVPTARGLVLEDLMREVDDYGEVTGNKVMMEYILIADVNSSDRCAHQLGTLLANCKALVMLNIIPYNPTASGDEHGYRSPTDADCRRFKFIVAEYRRQWDAANAGADGQAGAPLLCTVRWSTVPGQAQAAACGQLALQTPALKAADIEDVPGVSRTLRLPTWSSQNTQPVQMFLMGNVLSPWWFFITSLLLGAGIGTMYSGKFSLRRIISN